MPTPTKFLVRHKYDLDLVEVVADYVQLSLNGLLTFYVRVPEATLDREVAAFMDPVYWKEVSSAT